MWHYVNAEGRQVGPIGDLEFNALVKSGAIQDDTLVWKEGMPEWVKYSASATMAPCSECGREYLEDDMVKLGGAWVCAGCKSLHIQKLREGVPTGSATMVWRSGKQLVTPLDATLPQRCIKCNEPTNDKQMKRKLYWHSPAIYLIILVGLLIYVIVAMCCRKKATVLVSICPKHRAARRNVILVGWLLVLGGLVGAVWGFAANYPLAGFLGIAAFLGGMIYGIGRGRLVFATKIDKEHLWLGGCKPEFLAGFPEWNGPK